VDVTGRGGPIWKRDLEMWTAGYKYSWRKMETAAQNRAGKMEKSVLWPMF